MLLLDVNVLLAVHRQDHPLHAQVRAWFDALVEDGADFGVPLAVWASFLRIGTNRRIFTVPTPLTEAFDFIEAVQAQAGYVSLEPGARHLLLLRRIAIHADAYGNLMPDAVLVAVAAEAGAGVATLDRDFARFDDVPVVRPLRGVDD